MDARKVGERFAFGIEDLILAFIVVLNLLDFFEVIPDYLDYIKKVIEWSVLAYLLYKVSLSKLFFGKRSKSLDVALIASYTLLMFKSIAGWAHSTLEESATPWVRTILEHIITNQSSLTYLTFVAGSLGLIALALIATRLQVKPPSVLAIIHTIGHPQKTVKDLAVRFVKTYIVFMLFFVIVFNLLFEWLAIAVDAPLAVIAIFVYILFFVRHKARFSTESFLYKIGNFGERFYENVIRHFIYKETLLLGISGMLVLHLLADFANYILPYLIQLRDVYYYYALDAPHETIYLLASRDIVGMSAVDVALVVLAYLQNLAAIIILLVLPAVLWHHIYAGKILRVKRWHLCAFYLALPALVLMPSFSISLLGTGDLVGVDIIPQSVLTSGYALEWVLFISVLLCMGCLVASYSASVKKALAVVMVISSQVFFGYYLFQYSNSVFGYYAKLITSFSSASQYFLAAMFLVLLLCQIVFYIGGFLFFEYEIVKKLKKYVAF